MKKNSLFSCIVFLVISLVLSSCSLGERISEPEYDDWKILFDDSEEYASAYYNDSGWQTVNVNGKIDVQDNQHTFWLRKQVEVPASLDGSNVWLGFQKTNCAAQVYADGVYLGGRGSFPPYVNVKIEENNAILIPSNFIHNGEISLAIRIYSPGSLVKDLGLSLDNDTQGFFINKIKNVFNQRIFLCIGTLCFFILFYSLLQYFMDRKNTTFLYFSGCLLFIILYFYDLGSENTVIDYNVQRAFTRACLPISMMFLMLFLNKFYNRKKFKLCLGIAISVIVIFVAAFMLATGNDTLIDNLFLISMLPTVGVIVYGFIVTVSGIKAKIYDSIPVFIGFFTGSCCALHDIVCQVAGVVPFMWTQGFAFFLVDLSIFITLAIRESNIKKEVQHLASETQIQKDKLSSIIDKAQIMATESNSVASQLNCSVEAMIQSSSQTQIKVDDINSAIAKQTRIREETALAVNNLTTFLQNISSEFEKETAMIQDTAHGTQEVINGITTVGEGISTAAKFTSSLSKLTQAGSEDMKKLMVVMESIQNSSNEILSVVTTLDNFAQQTDLLAMNASIEAAHSGEAGKGFAVIAHEIKKLAAQTSQWSNKIADIITTVIKSIDDGAGLTSKVNTALMQIETDSVASAERVNAAWEGMKVQQNAGNEIAKDSTGLAQSATHMRTEIESQNKFAANVMNNMHDLMEASKAVNEASSEISSFTETLSTEAQNLARLAENTAKTAKDLMEIMKTHI